MVVRDHESVRRNKRAAPAGVEANAGLLQMIKPLPRRFELIFLFELLQRRRIKKPHPFIGDRRCVHSKSQNQDRTRKERAKYFQHGQIIECGRKGDKVAGEADSFPYNLLYVDCADVSKQAAQN